MRVYRSFCLILLWAFLGLDVRAQGDNTLTITTEGGAGGVTFWANNISPDDYHIIINMTRLLQLRCECILPFTGNIGPGRTRLFVLRREGISSSTDYDYNWSFMPGYANPEIKKDAVYLLPIGEGVITEAMAIKDIKEAYSDGPPNGNFYAIGLKMHSGDTIYATRDGKVKSIVDGWESRQENAIFSRQENSISIIHKDKTIGTYSVIRNGSFLVKERESVVAGQPLAIVGGDNYASGPHVKFSVSYLFFDESIVGNDDYQIRYVTPKFAIADQEPKVLEDKVGYKAVRPESVLYQDLSKREIKRQRKKRQGE